MLLLPFIPGFSLSLGSECVWSGTLFDGSLSSPWSRLPLSMVHKVGGLRLRSGVWHSSAQSSGSGLSTGYTMALLDASVAV